MSFVYTSNRQGELDPCGCPGAAQNGGIARMAAFLQSLKKKPRFVGDAGDTFFSVTGLLPTRRERELRQAHVIAKAYRAMGVDAFTPGERDFAEGIETLNQLRDESGAAFVSANITGQDGKLLFPPSVIVDKAGVKIGVIGAADPAAFAPNAPVRATAALPAVADEVKKVRAAGAQVVVLLSHLGLPSDRELAQAVSGIDLIIGAHSLDAVSPAQMVNGARIVQPIYQGQVVGELGYEGGKWSSERVVELGREWDKPGAVAKLVAGAHAAERAAAVGAGEKSKPHASGKLVGHPAACQACHAKQVLFWQGTKHASAYLPLFAKNQHFDPECIGCHSLGFGQKGGFSSITAPIVIAGARPRAAGETPLVEKLMTEVFSADGKRRELDSRREPERYAALKARYQTAVDKLEKEKKVAHFFIGVQCEHCHGGLAGHPKVNPKPAKVAESTCRKCHNPERSPEFQWAWRALVACPR